MPVPPDWPHDEPDVDREIHIEKMKRELDEIAGGKMISGSFGPVPSALEETFLEQVLAYERAELDTNFNRLIQRGIALSSLKGLWIFLFSNPALKRWAIIRGRGS
jgi:hypothetical protein